MRAFRLITLLAVLMAIFSLQAHAATILGSVVSNSDGTPLAGMTVAVYSPSGSLVVSATTNSSGRYSIAIAAGTYRALAYDQAGIWATSFYQEATSFDTSTIIELGSNTTVAVDFRLVRAGRIAGTVAASDEEKNLTGMVVTVYNLDGTRRTWTTTDANGGYTFILPPGSYRVAAWDDTLEYSIQFYSGRWTFGAATAVTVVSGSTVSSIDFALPKSAVISGVVTDRDTGAALANVVVDAWIGTERSQQVTTDSSGRYVIRVPPVELRLLAWDPSGAYATTFDGDAVSFEATVIRSPHAGASIDDVDFSLVRAGRIEGTVRGADDGRPLSSMIVAAFNGDGSVRGFETTDAEGVYSLPLPPGSYRIAAWDPGLGFLGQFHPFVRDYESAEALSVSSGSRAGGIDFLLRTAGRVTGVVTATADSQPVGGIKLVLYELDGSEIASAVSASDGRFTLLAEPGTYRLVAADPRHLFASVYYSAAKNFDQSDPLQVVAGSDVEVLIEMTLGARLHGTVVDASTGAPIDGVGVAAFDLAGDRIEYIETDPSGSWILIVPPGSYRIAAVDPLRRYLESWYDEAAAFESAKTIAIGSTIVREISFQLDRRPPFPRGRSVRHP